MSVQKRVNIKKKFASRKEAESFASGIEFSGTREMRVKDVYQQNDDFFVLIEKLERSKRSH